ncbi:hypothetical protein [Bradyrhizobium sp. SYSU BS000235]|uniref:hypothetical protein n=1 Tax=Bradyrhizobium sp. SYSU BS000235 TaxID=3411332 RepID=UPI003C7358FB
MITASSTLASALKWIGLIAFLVFCLLLTQGKLDKPLRWLLTRMNLSGPELAVEVNKLAMQQGSRFGFITVTNLSQDAITLKHVTINRNQSAGCSFDPKQAVQLGSSNILEPGSHAMIGTGAMIGGFCGSFMLVEIDTDRGSAEYSIKWR